MAVDTRAKRASVLGLALAPLVALPPADGAVGAGDRAGVAYSYAGTLTAVAVTPEFTARVPAVPTAFTVPQVRTTFAAPALTTAFTAGDPEAT